MRLQPLLMTCLLQLTPSELLGVMDALPPLVGHAVPCDESISIRLHHLLHSIQLGLSMRISYWLAWWLTMCVDYGWLLVKLQKSIQFEWPPWVFKLSWNSCTLHDHCIVISLFYWLYRVATPIEHHYAIFMLNCLESLMRLCFSP